MSLDLLLHLSFGWPVLLPAGLSLGCITVKAARRRQLLFWFVPAFGIAAVAFVLVTGGAASTPRFTPVQLGVGLVALAPAFSLALAAAAISLSLRAPCWLLWVAPASACLLSAPLVGYAALVAVCGLTGDCL
jgi:hypothetical protein